MSAIIMEKKNTKDYAKFEIRYKRNIEENDTEKSYDVLKEIEKKYGKIVKEEYKK